MLSLALLPIFAASALAGVLLEPVPQLTQSQNTATGEYGYSYYGGPSAKTELGGIDGSKSGSYSYIDANGITQTVNYYADENGFRAAGTNFPEGLQLLDTPEVALAKAAHLNEHARVTHNTLIGLQRKKRGVLATAYAAPIAYPAVSYHAAVPLATSHSSRVDIHHSPALITTSVHPAAYLLRKKRGVLEKAYAAPLPVTYAHSVALPTSTSSQSRFQIHNDAKIIEETHTPVFAASAAVPVAAAPVIAKAALPVAAAPALPVAAATPVIAKAALPVAAAPVYQTLPFSTSSQSRFQVHNGGKIIEEVSQHFYPTAPFAAAAVPVASAFPAQPVIASEDAISVEAA